jgi:hypothetical protein
MVRSTDVCLHYPVFDVHGAPGQGVGPADGTGLPCHHLPGTQDTEKLASVPSMTNGPTLQTMAASNPDYPNVKGCNPRKVSLPSLPGFRDKVFAW